MTDSPIPAPPAASLPPADAKHPDADGRLPSHEENARTERFRAGGLLAGRKILLGVTGGIAAYKSCELVRLLRAEGAQVQAVMTRGAREFIGPASLQALTGLPVHDDLWNPPGQHVADGMAHIALSRDADAIVIAPATAHFLGKIANGLCDDLLSTLVLARRNGQSPLLLAPAMNVEMWAQPAVQRNVAQLRADGALLLGPARGEQACGETGLGRMLEPAAIVEEIIAALQPKRLHGLRVLVTAGPTYEAIDPVRGITNRSSGKMGYAVARAAREAGAAVTLVSGPTQLASPHGVDRIDVLDAAAMRAAVLAAVGDADVFIAVAAVADWRPAAAASQKIKKGEGTPPALALVANPDILAEVAARAEPPLCVGFAAETDNVIDHARAKLQAKRLAMIVANTAQDAIGADESALAIVDATQVRTLPCAPKLEQARHIIAAIAERLPGTGS